MDQTPTAPDVIKDEAATTVEQPLARVPLILNRRNFSWVTERISGAVEQPAPRWWWVCFTITGTIAMFGLFVQWAFFVGVSLMLHRKLDSAGYDPLFQNSNNLKYILVKITKKDKS